MISTPTAPIYNLTYVSTMTLSARLRSSTLSDIAEAWQKNYTLTGVKGFIVFKQGKFLQYLEGDERSVISLYKKIGQDKRHKNIQLISLGTGSYAPFAQQEMYCFGRDEWMSGEEITPLMDKFDTYNWRPQQVEQVVQAFAQYRQQGVPPTQAYRVRVESYLFTLIKQFVVRHAVFLTLQLVFLLLFCGLTFFLL